MYHECQPRLSASTIRPRRTSDCPVIATWSSDGPATEVNEAKRPPNRGLVANSYP